MANFRTHFSVAAVASLTATALCLHNAALSPPQALLLFSLGTLAGLLPDIDSDHSVPTRLLFNALSVFSAIAMLALLHNSQLSLFYLLALALGAALFMRYVVYSIFAAITVHRGLFHSLPAALLFGLLMLALGLYALNWSLQLAWLAAGFVCGGYVLHLLLDEFYSVDFMGRSIKQSFGSALTIFSSTSWLSYTLLYGLVAAGFYFLPMPF